MHEEYCPKKRRNYYSKVRPKVKPSVDPHDRIEPIMKIYDHRAFCPCLFLIIPDELYVPYIIKFTQNLLGLIPPKEV